MKDRQRKVNVDKLSEQDLKKLEEKIGAKLRTIVDEAVIEANKILKVYGYSTKMQIVIEEDK